MTEFQTKVKKTDKYYDILTKISGAVICAIEQPLNSKVEMYKLKDSYKEGYIQYEIYFCKITNYFNQESIKKLFNLFYNFTFFDEKVGDFRYIDEIETNMGITTNHKPKNNENNMMCIDLEVFIRENDNENNLQKNKTHVVVK